jgi:hypothetical protein
VFQRTPSLASIAGSAYTPATFSYRRPPYGADSSSMLEELRVRRNTMQVGSFAPA